MGFIPREPLNFAEHLEAPKGPCSWIYLWLLHQQWWLGHRGAEKSTWPCPHRTLR
jgi:hypothetical protein